MGFFVRNVEIASGIRHRHVGIGQLNLSGWLTFKSSDPEIKVLALAKASDCLEGGVVGEDLSSVLGACKWQAEGQKEESRVKAHGLSYASGKLRAMDALSRSLD